MKRILLLFCLFCLFRLFRLFLVRCPWSHLAFIPFRVYTEDIIMNGVYLCNT